MPSSAIGQKSGRVHVCARVRAEGELRYVARAGPAWLAGDGIAEFDVQGDAAILVTGQWTMPSRISTEISIQLLITRFFQRD